ncbi:MAG: lmo0937 family membrane protein [Vulcanimicrobiaceae bacterium]
MISLLWTIAVILFLLWIAGLVWHFAGGLIYIALVVAIVIAVFNLLTGRRTTV